MFSVFFGVWCDRIYFWLDQKSFFSFEKMVSIFKFRKPFSEFELLILKLPNYWQTLPEVAGSYPLSLIFRTSQMPKIFSEKMIS